MKDNKSLICPCCSGHNFFIKYEATYIYSYEIDSDAPGNKNTDEFLPFLFDRREQKSTKQYLECRSCGNQYPCYFNEWDKGIGMHVLQEAIDSSAVEKSS